MATTPAEQSDPMPTMGTAPNSNENQVSQEVNGAMITAIEGIVTKLQQVAVGATNPSYTINKLTGIGENVDEWLEHFERHARLQQLTVSQYCDAFAFHVTGVAETWFFTLPNSTKTNWAKLREVCQQRLRRAAIAKTILQKASELSHVPKPRDITNTVRVKLEKWQKQVTKWTT